MSDNVHANLEDLRKLRRAIERAQGEVKDALTKVSRSMTSADWKDRARQDFEAKLGDATSAGRAVDTALDQLKPILDRKIHDLESFLR